MMSIWYEIVYMRLS